MSGPGGMFHGAVVYAPSVEDPPALIRAPGRAVTQTMLSQDCGLKSELQKSGVGNSPPSSPVGPCAPEAFPLQAAASLGAPHCRHQRS